MHEHHTSGVSKYFKKIPPPLTLNNESHNLIHETSIIIKHKQ